MSVRTAGACCSSEPPLTCSTSPETPPSTQSHRTLDLRKWAARPHSAPGARPGARKRGLRPVPRATRGVPRRPGARRRAGARGRGRGGRGAHQGGRSLARKGPIDELFRPAARGGGGGGGGDEWGCVRLAASRLAFPVAGLQARRPRRAAPPGCRLYTQLPAKAARGASAAARARAFARLAALVKLAERACREARARAAVVDHRDVAVAVELGQRLRCDGIGTTALGALQEAAGHLQVSARPRAALLGWRRCRGTGRPAMAHGPTTSLGQ